MHMYCDLQGVTGFLLGRSIVVGLHAALSIALGAALSVFQVFMFFLLQDR